MIDFVSPRLRCACQQCRRWPIGRKPRLCEPSKNGLSHSSTTSRWLNGFSSNSFSCSRNRWQTCAQHRAASDKFSEWARRCNGMGSPARRQVLLQPGFVRIAVMRDPRRLALSARCVATRQCETAGAQDDAFSRRGPVAVFL